MQNKNVITAILASMLVFLVWMTLAPKLFPQLAKNDRRLTTQPAEPELPSDASPQSTVASTQPASSPSSLPASNGGVPHAVVTGGPEIDNVVLGDASADSPYPMRLELTADGASVSSAHIRGHYETVKGKESYPALAPSVVALSEFQQQVFYSFTTVKLRLKGDGFQYDAPLEYVNWKLRDQSSSHVTWEAEIADTQNRPLARVSKAYELAPQTRESLTSDVTLKIDIQNLTAAPMSAILVQRGPVGMKREDQRSEDRRLVSAHWDGTELKSQTVAANKGKDLPDLGQDSDNVVDQTRSRIAWAAEANKYFTAVMAPAGRVNAQVPALFAKVHPLHLVENQDKDESAGSMTFQYITQPLTISPNGSANVGFDLYIGPKLKRAFDKVAVYKNRDYYQIIGAFYYFCAPAALVELMVKLLNMFHAIWPHNYGLAIILLVILVRTILHPITKRSQVNMTRMQKVLQCRSSYTQIRFG